MIRFRYFETHIKDEEYMNKMSVKGWNAKKLIEGFWLFTKKEEYSYTYRVYYFRGMSKEDVQNKIKDLQKENIEFVSKYSFWGIFRAKKDFQLYNKEEQLKICYKIRKPMIIAIILCPILIIMGMILTSVHKIFILFTCLILVYYLICVYLMVGYTKLINSLKETK